MGIAGTEEKCKWLVDELGFDAAINYKGKSAEQLNDAIRETCPKGVDVFFDNVGGETLNVALKRIRKGKACKARMGSAGSPPLFHYFTGARIVICGAISQYNAAQVVGTVCASPT